MDENNEIKQNRINQLTYILEIFDKVAYLNKLD
jgi:glycyl-tRNA synthetase beta subunit